MNILLPVDGSNMANQATHYVIKLIERGLAAQLHVVNVQAPLSGDISMMIPQETIESFHRERGSKETDSARALLDLAGVDYQMHYEVGDTAQKIAHLVAALEIDHIVMGSRGMSAVGNLLMGSVATKVLHLVDVPVTLVRK